LKNSDFVRRRVRPIDPPEEVPAATKIQVALILFSFWFAGFAMGLILMKLMRG
jgi:uncharacterized protein involved in exopolysaccharide biosynthesis